MSRPTKVPVYRKHAQSGQAVVTLTGPTGRRDIYLGAYGSPDSHREYARVIAEWAGTVAGPAQFRDRQPAVGSVNTLVLKFWDHAQLYYVKNGQPTSEQHNYKAALKPLRLLYGLAPVEQFTPISLKTLRQHYISQGLARSEVNRRTRLVRSVFRWGVEEGIVPSSLWEALRAVPGLKRGRSEARETEPVRPVEDSMIATVLPHLPPIVADMLRLQRLTGMRPGELCMMRPADIDREGPVWKYVPESHKSEHHGRDRSVVLGPRAQAIVTHYLDRSPTIYCFSPAEAEAARNALRSANRVTPRWKSHQAKRNAKRLPSRRHPPGRVYTPESYAQAIDRACIRAYPPSPPLARQDNETVAGWKERLGPDGLAQVQAWFKAHRFHPHQVRHRAAVEFRSRYGIETCRALLGHSFAAMADHYSKDADGAIGQRAAAEIG